MELVIQPKNNLRGKIEMPGDKSISHRSIMLGALSHGKTRVRGFLKGEDCLSTIACFRMMGIEIEEEDQEIIVHGQGLNGLKEPIDVLNAGNSGTTTRLLLGILSGQKFYSVLTGDSSLRSRPMARVINPLKEMGANIFARQENRLAPVTILPGDLQSIDYTLPVASAQVKSALLLAGLYSSGITAVTEPEKSRDHTERMLKAFGGEVEVEELTVRVKPGANLEGQEVTVPGDISSAAFFLVAGAIIPGSEIVLENVGLNPTRTGILEVLKEMGADIEILQEKEIAGEPVGDLLVRSSSLHGTTIEGAIIPRLIDEVPILAVAAAVAQGETVIKDAKELRVKETDRIKAMVEELGKMGVDIEERPDGMVIRGGKGLKGALCQSYDDHRVAMSLAVAGLVAKGETKIEDSQCIAISFPNFTSLLLGL